MYRKVVIATLLLASAVLAGCGGGGGSAPPRFTGQILSSQRSDADIGQSGGVFTITPATVSRALLYGLDASGAEFRAFLSFPLDGSGGGSVIPVDARVVSADLELFVNRVGFSSPVPTLLDLVAYPLSGPTQADYASAPVTPSAFRTFDVFTADTSNFVRIDVTPLVREAVARGFNDVQFRLMYDFVPSPVDGVVEIDDGPASTAPLLTIVYE